MALSEEQAFRETEKQHCEICEEEEQITEEQGEEKKQSSLDFEAKFLEQQEQLVEIEARYMRLAADFDNFRKRTERQTRDLILRANEDLICELLPVLDNYCLALDSIESESVRKGMKMIYDQLIRVLESQGLAAIGSVGCNFDPSLHEAVAHAESAEHGDNIVVEEIRRGYMLGGKVIRPSMVKVNIKKEE